MSGFTFSFSGDDIDESIFVGSEQDSSLPPTIEIERTRRGISSAFPIVGQEMLKPQVHSLRDILSELPSTISYKSLRLNCEDGTQVVLPRRELWDIRLQLMAEEDDESLKNLGQNDIKTGIYEGGFKSWESSSDLVKVLQKGKFIEHKSSRVILELGCGTAFPALFEFQQQLRHSRTSDSIGKLNLGLADYNPTVLQLVTFPNLILTWALEYRSLLARDGELVIDESLIKDFKSSMESCQVTFSFFSGGWGPDFVRLVSENMHLQAEYFMLIGAETIYSPFALTNFTQIMISLLKLSSGTYKLALVAAKTFYFGVGGTMQDFVDQIQMYGGTVQLVREEKDGVARAVVEVQIKE